MGNTQLKFYRGLAANVANAENGAIWFNTADSTINVKVNGEWERYAGQLKDASWKDQTLTITKYDNSKLELDFSNVATRSAFETFKGTTESAISNLQKDKLDASAQVVKSVDSNASSGINLSLTEGALDVTVTPGAVAADDASVVTGGAVYNAIGAAKSELEGKISGKNVSAEGDDYISVSANENNVTIAANIVDVKDAVAKGFLADAKDVKDYVDGKDSAMDQRMDAIETLIAEDDDQVINNLRDVINYFNGVQESETGAALLSTVAGHTTSIESLNTNKLETVTDNATYIEVSKDGTAIVVADTALQTKIGQLETAIEGAIAAGVTSFAGESGAITVKGGQANNGDINLTMNDKELQAAIVGLKSAAFTEASDYATAAQGNKADSAVQSVVEGENNGTIKVDDTEVAVHGLGSAAYTDASDYDEAGAAAAVLGTVDDTAEADTVYGAKAYADKLLTWAEF